MQGKPLQSYRADEGRAFIHTKSDSRSLDRSLACSLSLSLSLSLSHTLSLARSLARSLSPGPCSESVPPRGGEGH